MPWYRLVFKGFGLGAGAFVIAVGLEKMFWKDDDHGHWCVFLLPLRNSEKTIIRKILSYYWLLHWQSQTDNGGLAANIQCLRIYKKSPLQLYWFSNLQTLISVLMKTTIEKTMQPTSGIFSINSNRCYGTDLLGWWNACRGWTTSVCAMQHRIISLSHMPWTNCM